MSWKKLEMTSKGLQALRGALKKAHTQFKGKMTKADRRSLKAMWKMARRPDSRLLKPEWFLKKVQKLNPEPYKKFLMNFFNPSNKIYFRSLDPVIDLTADRLPSRRSVQKRQRVEKQRQRIRDVRENLVKPSASRQGYVKFGTIPTDTAVRNVRTYGSRMRDSSYGRYANSLRTPNIIKKEESKNNLTSSTSQPNIKRRQLSIYHTPTQNSNTTASSIDVRNVFASDNAGSGYRYVPAVSPIPLSTPARGLIRTAVEGVELLNEF